MKVHYNEQQLIKRNWNTIYDIELRRATYKVILVDNLQPIETTDFVKSTGKRGIVVQQQGGFDEVLASDSDEAISEPYKMIMYLSNHLTFNCLRKLIKNRKI